MKINAGQIPTHEKYNDSAKANPPFPTFDTMSTETDTKNEANDGKHKEGKFRRYFWNPLFKDKSAMWTAIFTAVLVFFTRQLVEVTDRIDETTRISQRAFVSFKFVLGGQKILSTDGKWVNEQVLAAWENSGTTPATNGSSSFNGESWPHDLPKEFDFPDGSIRPFVLGPKGIGSTPVIVSTQELDAVRRNKSRLFLWGWVLYHDVFPNTTKHLSEFCVELTNVIPLNPAKVDFTDPTAEFSWQTTTCPRHNCYDQDCPDYEQRVK